MRVGAVTGWRSVGSFSKRGEKATKVVELASLKVVTSEHWTPATGVLHKIVNGASAAPARQQHLWLLESLLLASTDTIAPLELLQKLDVFT